MKKTFTVLTYLSILFFVQIQAQDKGLVVHKSFDKEKIDFAKTQNDIAESEYIHIGFTPTFSEGIVGKALDLTSDVPIRIPIVLEKAETPLYDKNFSIDLWVKTKPNARQGTPIATNKKRNDKTGAGWIIGTNDLGAWYFNISDGKNTFNYEPTAQRQAINDGKWHNIVASVDITKGELWLYFDGRNVAIYNIEGLTTAQSELRTVIGGSDEYNDWGSRGEWTAFNGLIDEAKIYDKAISATDVKTNYMAVVPQAQTSPKASMPDKLKVQAWNIWHGGHRFGEHVGVERVIDVLKKENADVIGLVETYGSGAIIADSLDYYFYLISSNLSIMSRYPIDNTIKVFKPFFSGGALLDLGNGQKLAFFDIWLNYAPDECELFKGKSVFPEFFEKEKTTRQAEIKSILKEINSYIKNAEQTPVFMVGDFNCGSHLDWTEDTKKLHFDMVIDWQVSRSMINAGFKDSFREMNPNPLKDPGFTWSPLINPASPNQNCVRDRIDFIYYKGSKVMPYRSRAIEDHLKFWPSDHGSVVSWFYLK